jgi:hypothetical protein
MVDWRAAFVAAVTHSDTYSPHGSLYGGPGCPCHECLLDCRCVKCVVALLEAMWRLPARAPRPE